MEALTTEGIRCFRNPTRVRLAPLTVLVGENSSGKSTMLALCRLAWGACSLAGPIDFNEAPFELGTWDSIAHYHGGRAKRVSRFTLSCELRVASQARNDTTVSCVFEDRNGHPQMTTWSVEQGLLRVVADFGAQDVRVEFMGSPPASRKLSPISDYPDGLWFSLWDALLRARAADGTSKGLEVWRRASALVQLVRRALRPEQRPQASAPIRSRPRRTYDPVQPQRSPEGDHIPAILSASSAGDAKKWGLLKAQLDDFGERSGLFEDLGVRHLGARKARRETQPFGVELSIDGQQGRRSVVDVGYGVSQVLPILVESATAGGRTLLLQQPEVHLHPRAQAALGTFLVGVHQAAKTKFIVETHSDYLIDRIRDAVRVKALRPTDVSLVFLEREHEGVTAHPIDLDEGGQLTSVPASYREFFLEEQIRILGGADGGEDHDVPDR